MMSSSLPRFVGLLTLVVCGVAAFALVSVGSASAFSKAEEAEAASHDDYFSYEPRPTELKTEECNGSTCHEGKVVIPPGDYLQSLEAGFGAFRILEYGEDYCRDAEKDEGCEAFYRERPEKSSEWLAPKYKELPITVASGGDYRYGFYEDHSVMVFAWKPTKRRHRPRRRERFGLANHGTRDVLPACNADPVECATGNEVEAQTDVSVPALGVPFDLERTYNSQAVVGDSSPGLFGYGWASSFSDHLEFNSETRAVTVVQANGSTVVFFGAIGAPGEYTAPPWAQSKLVYTEAGTYKYTLPDQETFTFNSSGKLLSESERNDNTTTVSYTEEENCEGGCHKVLKKVVITDPAARKITLTVDTAGQIESASDPMGHTVKYTYEGGNLVSVTEPGESSARWKFKYNGAHEMTEMVNGLGGKTTTEYNSSDQVIAQTSPLGDTMHFEYEESGGKAGYGVFREESEEEEEPISETSEPGAEYYPESPKLKTTITNETTGAVELEYFNNEEELESVTRADGTPSATTESFTYNSFDEMTSHADGDKNTTEYGYNSTGDKTSEKNPDSDETKCEYNSTHDITGITTPNGEKTTIERNSAGDAIKVSRPAPGETTQATKYKYASDGELENMTNPLGKEWKYEYDSYGDRTAEIDPEANKRTWAYNEDSQETSTVTPRGHVSGATESSYKTTTERDAQGRPSKITNPLGQATKYTYNADSDVEKETDAESHTTNYTYNVADEPTKTEAPNKAITETQYNAEGEITARINGDKHTTKYERNLLGEITEEVNALSQKTTMEHDKAGNLTSVTDADKRTSTYRYDPASRLSEVTYSDGKTPDVKYEYNENGDRTKMTDGTGTTTYKYDQLDRLTEGENGHKEVVKYEYNLANNPTKITYPNGKAITHAYDNDDRLKSVTDWLEHATSFTYSPDSEITSTTFPSATSDVDSYAYNDADDMSEVTMKKSTETLGSLVYTRNEDDEVSLATTKDLPGEAKPAFKYDTNSRLTEGQGIENAYDNANNITGISKDTYAYNAANELETETYKKATEATYSFNEVGERTKTTPASGSATTYGDDEAGNLTSVARPKEGSTAAIEDTYAYNGEGLRASETITGTTNYLTWDTAELELPLILSNGTYSFIYGPGDLPIEQISSGGTVLYLHHDQQGSTRLLTGTTGKTEGAYTYNPYGTIKEHTGSATSALGYDAQYTSSDTGLIYMRARTYDPTTGQFLSVDPFVASTGEPYSYAGDNPVTGSDPTGLCNWNPASGSFWTKGNCLSEHPGQAVEGAAIGVCVIASAGACLIATGGAYAFNTEQNITKPCGFSLSEQAVITATAGIGALPGANLGVPQLLGWADEAPIGVNAILAWPGAIITILEQDIKRELLGQR